MSRNWIIFLSALATSGCHGLGRDDAAAKEAWAKCIFELDKLEAVRGRNLDDLDKGGSVARNQFMMDCLNVERAGPTAEQLAEMSQYATGLKSRAPDDMSLNIGKR